MAYITTPGIKAPTLGKRFSALTQTLREIRGQRRIYNSTLSELQSLSNRELADLGLSRATLRSVAYEAAYGANG